MRLRKIMKHCYKLDNLFLTNKKIIYVVYKFLPQTATQIGLEKTFLDSSSRVSIGMKWWDHEHYCSNQQLNIFIRHLSNSHYWLINCYYGEGNHNVGMLDKTGSLRPAFRDHISVNWKEFFSIHFLLEDNKHQQWT